MPAALRVPPIPAALDYLWGWFCELSAARSSSANGPNPISFSEMAAWAALTGKALLPRDVRAIAQIDQALFIELAEQDRLREAARRAAEQRRRR